MCGNGVRCFARFITELENLHGNQRYGFEMKLNPVFNIWFTVHAFKLIYCIGFHLHMLMNVIPCVNHCSFTVHTGAGLIVPDIVDDEKVCFSPLHFS